MTERFRTQWNRRDEASQKYLMCSLVAADPHIEATRRFLSILAERGVDIIEVVFPFSRPAYHGPAIRRSCERALREDVTWDDMAWLGREFRTQYDVPLVFSTYYNRVLARGEAKAVGTLSDAGYDSLVAVDLPFDEATSLRRQLEDRGMSFLSPIAPTTPDQRIEQLAENTGQCLIWTGHLGSELNITLEQFRTRMRRIQKLISKPVIASMKISTEREARNVASHCEGVLIGSALMWLIESRGRNLDEKIAQLIDRLRAGLEFG